MGKEMLIAKAPMLSLVPNLRKCDRKRNVHCKGPFRKVAKEKDECPARRHVDRKEHL